MKEKLKNTYLYENWIAKQKDENVYCTYEFPFFSDVYLTGEIIDILTPYYLFNPVPIHKINTIAPVIIFRADIHLDYNKNIEDMNKTNTSAYHGGWLNDEMSALLSLNLGIRLKSGGLIRYFDKHTGPKGKPEYHHLKEDPIFVKRTDSNCRIPNAISKHCINDAKELETFPRLPIEAANILIKSARMYQEAMWLSESEPELSWLLFVSAIETAANFWKKSNTSSVESLKDFNIDLYNILAEKGDEEFVKIVADKLAGYMGATKKFTQFILDFLPDPPENRIKLEYGLFNWDVAVIEESLKKIYDWRCKALHSGIPFPDPMCDTPRLLEGGYIEIVTGLARSAKQGVWRNEDTPMLLHLFEYITRKSLLKWWQSMIKS